MEPLRRRDRLWLLALPVYLLILVVRHEGSHATWAVLADGADVTSYALLPRVTSDGLERPHVRVRGRVSWASRFAPYAGDALLFLICFPIGLRASSLPKAVWLNVVAIGVASPLLNTAGNYAVGLARPASDVGRLLTVLPPVVVHMYFLITIAVYTGGAVTLYRRRTRP